MRSLTRPMKTPLRFEPLREFHKRLSPGVGKAAGADFLTAFLFPGAEPLA